MLFQRFGLLLSDIDKLVECRSVEEVVVDCTRRGEARLGTTSLSGDANDMRVLGK